MKKLIFIILLVPSLTFAKEYKLKITPCDKSSNCTKCYEQVVITYRVDEKSKTIILSGLDEKGSLVKETIKECTVSNVNNWSCNGTFLWVDVKNGEINIINNPKSSLANAGKEVCRIN